MTGVKYRSKFATAGRLAPIENWLKLNIEGQWSIKLDDVSDDMSKKNYLLLFDDEDDRNSFARRFTQGKEAYEKKLETTKPGIFKKVGAFFGGSKAKTK